MAFHAIVDPGGQPQILAPVPLPVRKVVRTRTTPSWLIPTLATLFISMIVAVTVSDLVLGFHVVAAENSVASLNIKGSGLEGCCPLGWKVLKDRCYYISEETLSWQDSRDWCQKHHAQLFILNSNQDWELVNKKVPLYWVGLSDLSGKWQLNQSHWRPGQPDSWYENEDCAHLKSGRLNDLRCGNKLHFICKIEI